MQKVSKRFPRGVRGPFYSHYGWILETFWDPLGSSLGVPEGSCTTFCYYYLLLLSKHLNETLDGIPPHSARRTRVAREQGLHVTRQTCCVDARVALAALALLLLLVQGTQAIVLTCCRGVLAFSHVCSCCVCCSCIACITSGSLVSPASRSMIARFYVGLL